MKYLHKKQTFKQKSWGLNNELIDGVSIFWGIISLYCDNKFDNLLRINSRSAKFEKINVPP